MRERGSTYHADAELNHILEQDLLAVMRLNVSIKGPSLGLAQSIGPLRHDGDAGMSICMFMTLRAPQEVRVWVRRVN